MKYLACTQIFASRINQNFADEILCVSLGEINSPKCFQMEYFWQFSFRKAIRAIVQGMIFNFPKKKKVKGKSFTKKNGSNTSFNFSRRSFKTSKCWKQRCSSWLWWWLFVRSISCICVPYTTPYNGGLIAIDGRWGQITSQGMLYIAYLPPGLPGKEIHQSSHILSCYRQIVFWSFWEIFMRRSFPLPHLAADNI